MPNFQVAANGSSVETATGPSSLLNGSMPLTKLDTTNTVSFQTISVLFNHEPAQPDPVTFYNDTQLYQFKHGYNYIPACWMSWQNASPSYPANPSTVGASATTFFAFGDDTASADIPSVGNATGLALFAREMYDDATLGVVAVTAAFVYMVVDTTNVTIYLRKFAYRTISGSIVPIYVAGETVKIRPYVFTEPATTSTY